MKKKYILFTAFSVFLFFNLKGQDQPLYNQSYFNPYLYNPSYVGHNGGTDIFLTFRRQWINIDNAPQVSSLNVQHSTKGNVALGLSIQSETDVGLTSNTGYLTFGYKIRLADAHYFKFGLSAGVVHYGLDIDELTNSGDGSILNDPALLNALDDTYYFSSQFGLHYKYKGLTLGFALPRLFENDVNSTEELNDITLEEFEHRIIDASYLFDLGPTVSLRPYLLYRSINKNQNQIEASAFAYYKDLIWVGAGYRLDYGVIGHVGLSIQDMFRFGYSYEFQGITDNSFSSGSHEFHLNITLGRKKGKLLTEETSPQPEFTEIVDEEPEEEIDEETEEATDPIVESDIENTGNRAETPVDNENQVTPEQNQTESNVEEEIVTRERVTPNDIDHVSEEDMEETVTVDQPRPPEDGRLGTGNYVIVGAFFYERNAESYSRELIAAGYTNQIGRVRNSDFYYVYLTSFDSPEEAITYKNRIRSIDQFYFQEAWVLTLE